MEGNKQEEEEAQPLATNKQTPPQHTHTHTQQTEHGDQQNATLQQRWLVKQMD